MKFMESTQDHSELGVGIQQKLDSVYDHDTMFNIMINNNNIIIIVLTMHALDHDAKLM